jgi:uncharacterized membrane protein
VISPIALWPPLVGVACLVAGLISVRREFQASHGLDRLIALAGPLFAAPLAVFGTQHLIVARDVMLMVPVWMPFRLFWTYFVGIALLAAALSIIARKYVWLSALLVGIMIFLFVLLIHIPNVVKVPGNRIFWVLVLRETCFASGALVLAGTQVKTWGARASTTLTQIAGFVIAAAILFFAIQHFLHPEFAPGVPLEKITPAWVPFTRFWGYLVGAVLLIAGATLPFRKLTRIAATWVGVVMLLLTIGLYLPIYLMASGTSALVEGVNYVADTMLFAGTVLLLAAASPRGSAAQPAS